MSGNGDVKVNDDQPVQLAEAPEGEGVTSTTPARGLWDLLDEYRQLHATWRQTHTEEDRRRMRVVWSIPLTCPGSGMGETERIRPGQWDRCTPTVLSSDHWPEPEHLQYRGACLGCGWVAERTHRRAGGENAAVEDAHDHTHPGWRDIPVVGTPPSLETPARHARAVEQWRWLWESRLPDEWLARGGPIRTNRTPPGNRHVPGRAPGGGYDLASTTETAASLPERAGGQLGLF